jgi:hypothetical protein
MRRRVVEIIIIFLDIFPVISLGAGEAEKAFLEDLVFFVPEG